MVLTGADTWTLADGTSHPTGFWAEEFVEPMRVFRDAGVDITVATPRGVVPTVDEASLSPAPDLLRFYRDAVPEASDDLTVFAGLVHAPDGSGTKLAALVVCHAGDPDAAARELAPFLSFGSPVTTQVGPMPYPQMNTLLDDGYPTGSLNYWLSSFTRRAARRPDRRRRRALCQRAVIHDHNPVRALPRRRYQGGADRHRCPTPRTRLEPAHPVGVDRPGGHRRQHPLDTGDPHCAVAPPRCASLAQLPRRRPSQRRRASSVRAELRPASEIKRRYDPTTSSITTTTSHPRPTWGRRVWIATGAGPVT